MLKLRKLFLFLKFPVVHLPSIMKEKILEKAGYVIIDSINIHKYAANHIILTVQK